MTAAHDVRCSKIYIAGTRSCWRSCTEKRQAIGPRW